MPTVKNIYHVLRPGPIDWDEYVEFIVVASSEQDARQTHPFRTGWVWREGWYHSDPEDPHVDVSLEIEFHSWTRDVESLEVTLVGMADPALPEGKVLCANFKAG